MLHIWTWMKKGRLNSNSLGQCGSFILSFTLFFTLSKSSAFVMNTATATFDSDLNGMSELQENRVLCHQMVKC